MYMKIICKFKSRLRHILLSPLIITILFNIIFISCREEISSFDEFLSEKTGNEISLKYAEKFKITEYDDITVLSIFSFKNDDLNHKYVLSGSNENLNNLEKKYSGKNISFIKTPVKKHNISFITEYSISRCDESS